MRNSLGLQPVIMVKDFAAMPPDARKVSDLPEEDY